MIGKGKDPQPWQFGIKASIKSTRAIYHDLIENRDNNPDGELRFILTSRLNQDVLENLFSRIRALGGDNSHPGPVEFMRRVRVLLLSKTVNTEILVDKPAVEICDETDDLSNLPLNDTRYV